MNGSFLDLLRVHDTFLELFHQHQDALLDRDFARALDRLLELRRALEQHMRAEEELFSELFAATEEVRGIPLDLFLGEHKHLRELLGQFESALRRLDAADPAIRRRVLELLDEESLWKAFFRHHDERERNILYPALDRNSESADRARRLGRFPAA